jgi:hypothetical protein
MLLYLERVANPVGFTKAGELWLEECGVGIGTSAGRRAKCSSNGCGEIALQVHNGESRKVALFVDEGNKKGGCGNGVEAIEAK